MSTAGHSTVSHHDRPHWSWADTLATAKVGGSYRLSTHLFSLVRERCDELGCGEGDEIRCLENRGGFVTLERPDGRPVRLERQYAWFVQVEPVAQ